MASNTGRDGNERLGEWRPSELLGLRRRARAQQQQQQQPAGKDRPGETKPRQAGFIGMTGRKGGSAWRSLVLRGGGTDYGAAIRSLLSIIRIRCQDLGSAKGTTVESRLRAGVLTQRSNPWVRAAG